MALLDEVLNFSRCVGFMWQGFDSGVRLGGLQGWPV